MTENFITEVDIMEEAKDCFLTYADEVLTDRAIPSAEDGLLSAQRKILWTMEDYLNMNSKSKTKKCNALVGQTLATSYFHGDQACYGVLTKMAQEYLMRYPLITGQGSLGSQEANDLVASSRYTEAKPSIYTDLMMENFKKNVVPLKETYNGEFMEPVILPARFPNALCNGRQAIGISMAHNSLPHNLGEVCQAAIAYIEKNGEITVDELMEFIKGPDFPLGGQVINIKDVKTAFKTGHSSTSLKVRGDYEIEDNKIIFTSIPYRTYRNKIKEQINKNIEEFDKVLVDFNDESNVGTNKLVFTVKDKSSISVALNKLFALTDLQTTLSYNMNFIVNGTPKLCSLYDLIKYYVEHQENVLIKATEFDKDKAEKRLHILNGLIAAIDKIDEVIALIRGSADKNTARQGLMSLLGIDEIQANAILDMKLGKLTRIDKQELVDEKKEKEALIAEYNKILSDKQYRNQKIIADITELKNKYGDARRTKLDNVADTSKEEKEIEFVEPEKVIVVTTEGGNIKRIPASSFKTQRRNGKGIKSQNDITSMVLRTNTVDSLMLFTNKGKMYRLLVDNIPQGTNASAGVPIGSLIQMDAGEKVSVVYSIHRDTDAQYVLFTTAKGYVKKTALDEYVKTQKKTGIAAIKLEEDDELVSVNLIKEEPIILVTKNGQAIHFKSDTINPIGRIARGVKGITLKDDDKVVSCLPIRHSGDSLAIFTHLSEVKKTPLKEYPLTARAGKGILCTSKSSQVAAAVLISDEDSILVCGDKTSICVAATDIPALGRSSVGNMVIKGNHIVSVSKI